MNESHQRLRLRCAERDVHTLVKGDWHVGLWVLRNDLGLTGTKFGCGQAHCGACTVVIGKDAVRSCSIPVKAVAGEQVLTIEGLGSAKQLHPVQQAFLKHHALQCGYCTPGMILSAYALLQRTPQPSRAQVLESLEGNLCRCGAHTRILDAVEDAAVLMKGRA